MDAIKTTPSPERLSAHASAMYALLVHIVRGKPMPPECDFADQLTQAVEQAKALVAQIEAPSQAAAPVQYLREFPDFDHDPALPDGFEDVSWHNDASPSFQFMATGNILYVNYAMPERREYEALFFVLDDGTKGEVRTLYTGDDRAEALRVAMTEAK